MNYWYQLFDWIEDVTPLCIREAAELFCFASFLLMDFLSLTCNFSITYLLIK